ncbi:hypothetical protein CAL29_16560 [Bordetella genomosp. 10]|uniref:protein O-GlcNAc transferase n=1 Tax=Bordetella genomosp. 10 TaxID=1416804 RepID=A0A261RXX8_9BORD|nr:methyltransferase domain-containing protein [Bordetella genomosp. 10]OZI29741.1 hypothetical protein CAL29_16560 [Bordetella genomosp. 10]
MEFEKNPSILSIDELIQDADDIGDPARDHESARTAVDLNDDFGLPFEQQLSHIGHISQNAGSVNGAEGNRGSEETPSEGVHFWLSPIQLRASAYLYGIETVALENAKVLEIGCGSGSNILPFAAAYPKANVVGLDLDTDALTEASDVAAGMGLHNVQFLAADLESLKPDFGQFDYIIAHNVFGRSRAETTGALLRVCRENLSPKGIAFISYNAYPGWKAAEIVRDGIMLHTRSAETDHELVEGARAAIRLLFKEAITDRPISAAVKSMADTAERLPEADLIADYLVSPKSGWYLLEFAEAAGSAGLAYVGDTRPEHEIAAAYGHALSLNHSLAAMGQPKLVRQQYLDFMVGRESRGSLLVDERRAGEILPTPDLTRLQHLRVAGRFSRLPASAGLAPGTVSYLADIGQRRHMDTDDDAVIAVIEVLNNAWPMTVDFETLVSHPATSCYALSADERRASVFNALTKLFKQGMLRYCLGTGPYDHVQTAGFRLIPGFKEELAKIDGDKPITVSYFNLWHQTASIMVSGTDRALLSLLDETTTIDSLFQAAKEISDSKFPPGRSPLAPSSDLATCNSTVGLMDRLRRSGVVQGTARDWRCYFSSALSIVGEKTAAWLQYVGPLTFYADRAAKSQGAAGRSNINRPATPHTPKEVQRQLAAFQRSFDSDDFEEAIARGRLITEKFPGVALGWLYLGTGFLRQGAFDEAFKALRHALAMEPLDAKTHATIGLALQRSGDTTNAEICLRRTITLAPKNHIGHSYLGSLLWSARRMREAEACFTRAAELAPEVAENLNNLALALMGRGELEKAIDTYRRSLARGPDLQSVNSNFLFLLSHYENITPEALFEEHCRHGNKLVQRINEKAADLPPYSGSLEPSRRLRIGFVSSDLYNHAVAYFLEPVWGSLDRNAFEIYAYHTDTIEDATTVRLRQFASKWCNAASLTDIHLAREIRRDRIDILFDLAGHSGMSRMPVFAMKPAPIMVNWIGHPSTTGLPNMDYHILDRHVAQPGELDDQFSEKLVHLKAALPFALGANSPGIQPLPAIKNGYLTFGTFNRATKIGPKSLELWARVMQALPDAKLLVGALPGGDAQRQLIDRIVAQGISEDRLLLRPRVPMGQYLNFHADVDILLDTIPFTGLTVTCNAMWMGVPTLTLRGQTRAGRQSAGVMSHLGLPEFVADNEDDLIKKAVFWRSRLEQLASIRRSMRERLEQSSMRPDGRPVARSLEAAMRVMWHRYCNGLGPEAFVSPE